MNQWGENLLIYAGSFNVYNSPDEVDSMLDDEVKEMRFNVAILSSYWIGSREHRPAFARARIKWPLFCSEWPMKWPRFHYFFNAPPIACWRAGKSCFQRRRSIFRLKYLQQKHLVLTNCAQKLGIMPVGLMGLVTGYESIASYRATPCWLLDGE